MIKSCSMNEFEPFEFGVVLEILPGTYTGLISLMVPKGFEECGDYQKKCQNGCRHCPLLSDDCTGLGRKGMAKFTPRVTEEMQRSPFVFRQRFKKGLCGQHELTPD